MGFLSGLAVAAKVGAGLYSASRSHHEAGEARHTASKRASDLKIMAGKEYKFNLEEYKRAYGLNIAQMYNQTSSKVYDLTKTLMDNQSNILVNTAYTGGVSESSRRNDMMKQVESMYNQDVNKYIDSLTFNTREMAHGFSTDIEQLKLNKEKMEKDISNSLSVANRQSQATKNQAISGALGALSGGYTMYNQLS